MGSALAGVDEVGEGEDAFQIGVVVLESHVHIDAVPLSRDAQGRCKERFLATVEIFHEGADASLVGVGGLLFLSEIPKADGHTGREEGQFPEARAQDFPREVDGIENLGIGKEMHFGPRAFRVSRRFERALGDTPLVALAPFLAVAPDREGEPFRERVHHGHTHAVQAPRDLVGLLVELAARVKYGEHHFRRGFPRLGMDVHGDAPSVVLDGDAVVRMDGHFDPVAVAREGFVESIVHHLVNEMVKSSRSRVADVHAGAFSNRLESLEDLNILCCILLCRFRCRAHAALPPRKMGSLGCEGRFPNEIPMPFRQSPGCEARGHDGSIPENDGGLALVAHKSHHATQMDQVVPFERKKHVHRLLGMERKEKCTTGDVSP